MALKKKKNKTSLVLIVSKAGLTFQTLQLQLCKKFGKNSDEIKREAKKTCTSCRELRGFTIPPASLLTHSGGWSLHVSFLNIVNSADVGSRCSFTPNIHAHEIERSTISYNILFYRA